MPTKAELEHTIKLYESNMVHYCVNNTRKKLVPYPAVFCSMCHSTSPLEIQEEIKRLNNIVIVIDTWCKAQMGEPVLVSSKDVALEIDEALKSFRKEI